MRARHYITSTLRQPLGIAMLICLIALCSCQSRHQDQVHPPEVLPVRFSTTGKVDMPAKWWESLEDNQLNQLMERALRGNFSLRAAWDRLAQAKASSVKAGAGLWPSLDASGGISRTRIRTGASSSPTGSGRTTNSSDFSLGLAAAYEVDLWGRVRSSRNAAELDALASESDLRAAAISLTAEIASVWYRLVEQQGQLRLLDEQVATNQKQLSLITLKFRKGQSSAADLLQQRQLVESNRGERVLVKSTMHTLEHSLAVLVGEAPGNFSIDASERLPDIPALPRTGIPAEWIRRRPDIRASELRIHAADQRVGEAVANQFPKLTISTRTDSSASHVRDLFDNWLASLAANVVAPILDGGLRRTEVERTRAVVSERVNNYSQVVLTSLKEVEDALTQEARQAEYVESLRSQLELSQKSTKQIQENYIGGAMTFTRYLTTLLSHQKLQRNYLQAQRNLLQYRLDLYRALAGSWSLAVPNSSGDVDKVNQISYSAGGQRNSNSARTETKR
jgi:outer membrane protein, multidrug efflux system